MPKFYTHCYLFGHLKENCRYLSNWIAEPKGGKTDIQLEKTNTVTLDKSSKRTEENPIETEPDSGCPNIDQVKGSEPAEEG